MFPRLGQTEAVRYAWIFCVWSMISQGSAATRTDRPNIVLITADCVTFDRLGSYGSKATPLPQIDRLANGGARFDNFYVSPGETVTMVTLLTGRYPFRQGWLWHNDVEKWGEPSLSPGREVVVARPLRDRGYTTGLVGRWPLNDQRKEASVLQHGFLRSELHPVESAAQSFVIGFVRKNVDRPFFLYARLGNGSVKSVDQLIGALVNTLNELKLTRQTIIILTRERIDTGSHNLREPSIKVPLVFYGTHHVRNQVIEELTDFTDLFPTLIELAGARLPKGRKLDGRSLVPQLRGDRGRPREWIFSQYGTDRILANWQYKIYSNGRFYNLLSDPNELHNLSRANVSEVVAERERLQKLLKGMPADSPLNFPYARRLRIRKR
ncbi:MAG: sulfatase-like hydrolase/transferase [Limisphaerales bacterium]